VAGRALAVAATWVRHGARAAVGAGFGLRPAAVRRAAWAREARLACEELGPAFVKLGQLASVRPDAVGPEVAFELERLRDRLPPVPIDAVRDAVARELGAPPERLFRDFDPEPVATASIAQVHRAALADDYRPVVGAPLPAGTPVAVKVVRPAVAAAIAADLALARRWAVRVERWPSAARWRPVALVDEFAASVARELDLRVEGRLADRVARDFADDPVVAVPRVVWRHTTRGVLVAEFLEGWSLADLGAAERAGVDGRALAEHGARAFLRQVLVHGRFHADLHPANLVVTRDGRIGYVDFGIVGTTTPAQRGAIAQVLVALAVGDPERALAHARALGLEVADVRVPALRAGFEALARAHLRGRTPSDVRGFALGFLRLLADQRVALPEGFGLLIKALVTVEGVGRALYPDLDLLEVAAPFAARLVAREAFAPARLRARAPAAVAAALRELLR
jgi:ubiquinone biosynthesis protein